MAEGAMRRLGGGGKRGSVRSRPQSHRVTLITSRGCSSSTCTVSTGQPMASRVATTRGGDLLEAVDQSPVRPKLKILHHLLQADEVLDVDRRRVFKLVCCWVEVEEVHVPAERLGVGDDGVAEG